MLAWPRSLRLCTPALGALVGAALLASPSPAGAQTSPTPAEQAAKLADEGKGLSADNKNAEASEKFRQAVVLSPEGKFYLYLCISLSKEGKLGEALNACDAVERNGADEKTLTKTRAMMDSLRSDMKKQGMDPDKALAEGKNQTPTTGGGAGAEGGGSSSVGVPAAMPQYTGAPPVSVYGIKTVPHEYTWSLGASLFGAATTIGDSAYYESAGGGFRVFGDYLLSKRQKIGAQAYIGATSVAGKDNFADLAVIDFGLAGFKHFCGGRVCITPLVGAHFTGMQPDNGDDEVRMATVGARVEGEAALALGSHFEHVLSLSLGVNAYAPAIGDYAQDPADFGLDKGSTAVYFGLGYSYRFNTPIGQSPFITFD